MDNSDKEARIVVMTCCVLFHCFEAALGHTETAMCHLDSALSLLSQYPHRVEYESSMLFEELRHVLECLDVQATLFNDDRVPRLAVTDGDEFGIHAYDATNFLTPLQAHQVLVRLHNRLFRFLIQNITNKSTQEDNLPPSVLRDKEQLLKEQDAWMSQLQSLNLDQNQDSATIGSVQTMLIH
jgi:hypothetical protein